MRDWFAAFRTGGVAPSRVTRVTRVTKSGTPSPAGRSPGATSVTHFPMDRVTGVTTMEVAEAVTRVTSDDEARVTSLPVQEPHAPAEVSPAVTRATRVTLSPKEVPPKWTQGVSELDAERPPHGVPPERWRQAVLDAVGLLEQWGSPAANGGWTTLDLFGVHPTHPDRRVDCAGLAWLLDGGIIRVLAEDHAVILRPCDSRQTYRRVNRSDLAVPMWDLPARVSGGA